MTKHLSIYEKINAENEYADNKAKIKVFKEKINFLQRRNERLLRYIHSKSRSKYDGLYGIDGICFKMFGKRVRDLEPEEIREYNRVMKAKERERRNKC